jgi:hypothetical protein
MSKLLQHMERLRTGANEDYDFSRVGEFITQHTYLKGEKFSFAGHEYQARIAADTSRIVNTQKVSQCGLSELTVRMTLAYAAMFPEFNVGYTMPFSGDARDFCKTRAFPVIAGSPRLQNASNPDVFSTEIIQLNDSFVYFRGTNGSTQAISIPLSMVVSDEIDRSNPEILTTYTSRLAHSPYKLRRNFSTPTIEGHGIDLEMRTSRRFKNFCKCNHCGHWFYPDYFAHVKIPGFDNELESITKNNLKGVRYNEAELLCPSCGKKPSLKPKHREWVLENTEDNHEAAGYYVSPFDSEFRTPDILVRESTEYALYSEFKNQALGLTASQDSESLTQDDLDNCKTTTDLNASSAHCMGIDVGVLCHIYVGRMTLEGQLLVVHREVVPISNLETRRLQLKAQYRVLVTVIDSQPFTDTVARMQRTDKSVFGANFSVTKTAAVFAVKEFDGLVAEGKLPINLAKISRDKAFDQLLELFKRKEILIYQQEESIDRDADRHYLSLKRVQKMTDDGLVYQWVKPASGDDDHFFALLFLLAACKLRGEVGNNSPLLGPGRSIFGSFKVKS